MAYSGSMKPGSMQILALFSIIATISAAVSTHLKTRVDEVSKIRSPSVRRANDSLDIHVGEVFSDFMSLLLPASRQLRVVPLRRIVGFPFLVDVVNALAVSYQPNCATHWSKGLKFFDSRTSTDCQNDMTASDEIRGKTSGPSQENQFT